MIGSVPAIAHQLPMKGTKPMIFYRALILRPLYLSMGSSTTNLRKVHVLAKRKVCVDVLTAVFWDAEARI